MEKIGNIRIDAFGELDTPMYNEGDEVEERVLRVFQQREDTQKVLAEDHRWPILYQLSNERGGIVEPMALEAKDRVLEIGAGMGTISGALAKRCKQVDCVEMSLRRSRINAYRNQQFENIHIYCGNYQQFDVSTPYDAVVIIGVLEYAQSLMRGENPYHTFMRRVHEQVKPGGRVYLAIENKLGMKYFSGCCEDHVGQPFHGIEGYSAADPAKTFTKSQLEKLFKECGFGNTYFYYPLPDYKMPFVIYSDDYLPQADAHYPYMMNFDNPRLNCFDEGKAVRELCGAEEFKMMANSFLVEAVRLSEAEEGQP